MIDERSITKTLAMPSLDYVLSCSETGLHDIELVALGRSANCLRAARLEWEEAIAQREIAGVARWLIENRGKLLDAMRRTINLPEFPPGH